MANFDRSKRWQSYATVKTNPICPLCHERNVTDYHHILNRAHISKSRQGDIPEELCTWLCNQCNVTRADNESSRYKLLKLNVLKYGYLAVWKAWAGFRDTLLSRPMWIQDILQEIYQEMLNDKNNQTTSL